MVYPKERGNINIDGVRGAFRRIRTTQNLHRLGDGDMPVTSVDGGGGDDVGLLFLCQ